MKNYWLIFFLLFQCIASAQMAALDSNGQQPGFQPTVMVIPFVKADQDIRTFYEQDAGSPVRTTISLVKDGLDQTGIRTIDFRAILKQAGSQNAITIDQQSSIKQKVIELSAADIYVESETRVIRTPRGNSVTVILTAYDAFTGLSLVNKLGHSPKFYTHNYEKLAEKALDTFLEDFTKSLQVSLQDMIENGRTIAVDIGCSEGSEVDMDSEIGSSDELLANVIETWLEENALGAYFHIQGITATKMIIDEVKIPVIDPLTNKHYRPSQFAASLRKFLISQGLEVTRDIQGAKIFLTISG